MTSSPLSQGAKTQLTNELGEPIKHVIAEYKHRAQTITCVCGWHGSTISPDGRRSEWTDHLAANRPVRK